MNNYNIPQNVKFCESDYVKCTALKIPEKQNMSYQNVLPHNCMNKLLKCNIYIQAGLKAELPFINFFARVNYSVTK